MKTEKIIKASFFHSPKYGEIEFLEHTVLLVSDNGIISKIIRKEDENYQQILDKYSKDSNFIDFKDKVLLPGFIDLHIHAPQWPQAGLALDDELSHWLNNFTFPLESKYEDINYAREVYSDLVKTLLANGTSTITETVFENRFMHVEELRRMNAKIRIEGRSSLIEGLPHLEGTTVKATDLRSGAALVIAGLMATGTTKVINVYHIDRGYVDIEEKMRKLGADIQRIDE